MLLHHPDRHGVIGIFITCVPVRLAFRNYGDGLPYQFGAGELQLGDDCFEVRFILFQWNCYRPFVPLAWIHRVNFAHVPDTEVEADHVPLRRADPSIDVGQTVVCVTGIVVVVRNVGLVANDLLHERRVAHRNRIADDQYVRRHRVKGKHGREEQGYFHPEAFDHC
ncbi:hypothetical protein D3C71_1284080 [compost metagenome]